MTTYSKKYFNSKTQKWETLFATEARSAYEIAVENGYTGTEDEFNKALGSVGTINLSIDDVPTANSKNLVYSGGVKSALNELDEKINNLEIPEAPEVDLSNYYTKSEIENKNYLTSVPEEYITESELDAKLSEVVPPEVDLSNYYTKEQIENKQYATKKYVDDAVSNIDTSEYLSKTDAQLMYQKKLNATDALFRLNGTQVLYGSDIVLDSSGDVTIEAAETVTLFAYTSTNGESVSAPTGGSVTKSTNGYVVNYPYGWYDSEWAQNELNNHPEKTVWYSYATFAVNGMPPIVDWSYPLHYAKDGKPGEDGASIEYVYYLQAGKSKTWNGDTYLPSNDWAYDSPVEPWTDNPKGVDVNNQTEWTCVRTKAQGASTWGPWSSPSLWSVFGEEGKDGPGLEYIFKLTRDNNVPMEVTELPAVQHDDYVPDGWSDNTLSVDVVDIYLWCSVRRKKDGQWSKFEKPSCWARYAKDGEQGVIGDRGPSGIPAIEWRPFYCLGVAKDTTLAKVNSSLYPNINRSYLGIDPTTLTSVNLHEIHGSNWYELPIATTEELPYLYVTQAKITRDRDTGVESLEPGSSWCEPFMLTGEHGKDGIIVTVVDVIEYYLATDKESDVTFNKNTWTAVSSKNSNKVPVTSASKPYLWNVECVVYSDDTETYTDPVRIGNYAKDGKGILNIEEFYVLTSAAHTTGVKAPSHNGSRWNYNFTVSGTTYTWEPYEYEKHRPSQEQPCLWNVEIVTYDDNSYHVTSPAMIGQALNVEDLKGKAGPIAYPAGIYDPTKVYTADERKAPYVYDSESETYYVLDKIGTWQGTKDGTGQSLQKEEELQNFAWVKFEQFDALYAKLAIVPNGLIGSAVFNGDYMFSQIGIEYKNGNASPSNDTDYQYFTTDVADAIFDGNSITNGFVPNILFDLYKGRGWFGAGETLIYEDGSIVTRHIATVYDYVKEPVSNGVTDVTSLLTIVEQYKCKHIGDSGYSFELNLTDTAINKPGVWYEGEVVPAGCLDTSAMIKVSSERYKQLYYTSNDDCFAFNAEHPFRFLFKWDGVDKNNLTGDIIVIEPLFREDVKYDPDFDGDTVYYESDTTITEMIVGETSKLNTKVLVCPANCFITFDNSQYALEQSVSSIVGSMHDYKVYCVTWVSELSTAFVNCSLYSRAQ